MTTSKLLSTWNQIELILIGLLGAGALLLALYVMATRYLLPTLSIDWGDELIVYLLVWATWLSGSRLVWERGHVQTDIVLRKANPFFKHALSTLHLLVGVIFSVSMAVAGCEITWFAFAVGENTESSMHFPLWLYYLAIPCGFVLMAIRYGYQLVGSSPDEGAAN